MGNNFFKLNGTNYALLVNSMFLIFSVNSNLYQNLINILNFKFYQIGKRRGSYTGKDISISQLNKLN